MRLFLALLTIIALPVQAASNGTFQQSIERQLLEAEYARDDSSPVFVVAARDPSARIRRLAARAMGRLESLKLAATVRRLLTDADSLVRAEAVNALGQMSTGEDLSVLLVSEKSPTVRASIFETIGRLRGASVSAESVLRNGLGESTLQSRAGAARGLESLVRRTARSQKPDDATIMALRRAVQDTKSKSSFASAGTDNAIVAGEMRENALLALLAAGDRDSTTIAIALLDPSAEVRRVAASASRRFVDDSIYTVRFAALRAAGSCEDFVHAIDDANEHVALLALDLLGGRDCGIGPLLQQTGNGRTWRVRSHALVSLAKVAPDSARSRVAKLANSDVWQARTYAAAAAKLLGDSATLRQLARDTSPNVAIAAMSSIDDAVRGLRSNHAALVMQSVDFLTKAKATSTAVRPMLDALNRFTRQQTATTRDPRVTLLDALEAVQNESRAATSLSSAIPSGIANDLVASARTLLTDVDPAVAARAAKIITTITGVATQPNTVRYRPAPLPSPSFMATLQGASAEIKIRGIGVMSVALLTDVAPMTVATFAMLAEEGKYNGLTFHRVVPNFVLQGGSPGANEYTPLTSSFMRDEVGMTRHARGTFGISTRGRDTGDGQIFINLVDNFRLDHDYTVFARIESGLEVMDRIQEGDAIENIRIIRKSGNR